MSGNIGQAHDPVVAFAARLKDYERRVADLERAASSLPAVLPRGVEGRRARGTATSWSNATTTLSAITVTAGDAPVIDAVLDPTRLYRVWFTGNFASTVADGVLVLALAIDGVASGGNQVHVIRRTDASQTHQFMLTFSPTDGLTHQYAMFGRRSTVLATTLSATGIMEFTIEDIGPA